MVSLSFMLLFIFFFHTFPLRLRKPQVVGCQRCAVSGFAPGDQLQSRQGYSVRFLVKPVKVAMTMMPDADMEVPLGVLLTKTWVGATSGAGGRWSPPCPTYLRGV